MKEPVERSFSKRNTTSALTTVLALHEFHAEDQAGSAPSSSCCTGAFAASVQISIEESVDDDAQETEGATGWKSPPDAAEFFGIPQVGTEIVCDEENRVWRARIYSVDDVKIETTVGKSPKELSDTVLQDEDTDCHLLCEMSDDVHAVMNSAARPANRDYWITDDLIAEHEKLHREHMRSAFEQHYQTLVGAIEALTRSCTDFDKSEAESDMETAINEAITAFNDAITSFKNDERSHIPEDDFIDLHKRLLQPWADKIDAAEAAKGCDQ